ncbi:MAG: DUF2442 domain-containing protein [Muribaculaceae bacterium]|nr:DUF2442 domain-containing protein [Muribaculaceae bacterium]
MNRDDVSKIWVTDSSIWVELKDGRKGEERFDNYRNLRNANADQRKNFVLSHFGIHWPEIDEDLSFDGFFL